MTIDLRSSHIKISPGKKKRNERKKEIMIVIIKQNKPCIENKQTNNQTNCKQNKTKIIRDDLLYLF